MCLCAECKRHTSSTAAERKDTHAAHVKRLQGVHVELHGVLPTFFDSPRAKVSSAPTRRGNKKCFERGVKQIEREPQPRVCVGCRRAMRVSAWPYT